VPLICPTAQAKYFCEGGLDDPNQLELPQQIGVYAHAIFEASRPGERSGIQKNAPDVACRTNQ
jgi:hypothetical protein